MRDVEVELAVKRRLAGYPVPDAVWEEYHLSEEINDRGIRIDRQMVENAIKFDERARESLESGMDEAVKCDPPLPGSELSKIWSSACRFAKKVQSQEGYVPPEEYEFENESLKPADYSDIGQAKALVREYKDELKFTPATDFIRYDGYRWVESKQRAVGAMEEFLDLQLEDAKDELDHGCRENQGSPVPSRDVRGLWKAAADTAVNIRRKRTGVMRSTDETHTRIVDTDEHGCQGGSRQ